MSNRDTMRPGHSRQTCWFSFLTAKALEGHDSDAIVAHHRCACRRVSEARPAAGGGRHRKARAIAGVRRLHPVAPSGDRQGAARVSGLTHANVGTLRPRHHPVVDSPADYLRQADRLLDDPSLRRPDAGVVLGSPIEAIRGTIALMVAAYGGAINGPEACRDGLAHLVVSLSARVERDPAHRADDHGHGMNACACSRIRGAACRGHGHRPGLRGLVAFVDVQAGQAEERPTVANGSLWRLQNIRKSIYSSYSISRCALLNAPAGSFSKDIDEVELVAQFRAITRVCALWRRK